MCIKHWDSWQDINYRQNNALEGPLFVPQNITAEDDLVLWIEETFPMFTTDDVSKVLQYYPGSNASDSTNAVDYATLGYTGATANNESSEATGQQQRANVDEQSSFPEHNVANDRRISTLKQHSSVLHTG
jgi:hypothetical protein